jgi:hypothetical protein
MKATKQATTQDIDEQVERLIADFGDDAPVEAWRIAANYSSELLRARDFDFWYSVAQVLGNL